MLEFDSNWAYAYGVPNATAQFKAEHDDFCVYEHLGYELTGEGEHVYAYIEKRGLTTQELLKELSRELQLSPRLFSTAGMKDKQGVTRQWVGIHVPGRSLPALDTLHSPQYKILTHTRHNKKLKTGNHSHNEFVIRLREVSDKAMLQERLDNIAQWGVPNYFGEQRFGHQGQNMEKAHQFLFHQIKVKSPFLRGMYYSAARSFLFNHILSRRVADKLWRVVLEGDVLQLMGRQSLFCQEDALLQLQARVDANEISPAAPLFGRGKELVQKEALRLQEQAIAPYQDWCQALDEHDLTRTHRAMILFAQNLVANWEGDDLMVSFDLPKGAYATALMRELVVY